MGPSGHLTRHVRAGVREIDVVVGFHSLIMRLDRRLVEGAQRAESTMSLFKLLADMAASGRGNLGGRKLGRTYRG